MLSSLMKITASNSKLFWDTEALRLKYNTTNSCREHCV